ncbi:hypothetical protein CRG98_044874 [Punica granatum]|uniref:Uncharacterized protein n=1 Tax=Punica granatum TaxID=22663 RepID=A0A2I0HTZ7_PUNGR|nr:hypothetical protein CRG98_044874 [Punica granatum]
MGWLSKILKGSSSCPSPKSKRKSRCNCHDHTGSSTMDADYAEDDSPENSENAELDCLTTRSQSEAVSEEGEECDPEDENEEFAEDERLALALQQNLSLEGDGQRCDLARGQHPKSGSPTTSVVVGLGAHHFAILCSVFSPATIPY